MASELNMPRTKLPIPEAETKDLVFWFGKRAEELASGTVDPKFKDYNERWVAAARAELEKRGELPKAANGGASNKPPTAKPANGSAAKPVAEARIPSAAIVLSPSNQILRMQGSYRDAAKITDMLGFLREHANLITPTMACPTLREGCEIQLSVVHVDPRLVKDGGETYSPGGDGLALVKSALLRIGNAAGVRYDSDRCVRLDDGSDSHRCIYKAVGFSRGFDGVWYELPPKTIELDLRGDLYDLESCSAQIQSMYARKKPDQHTGIKDITDQLREMRLFILRHTEGRAMAGLVRNLGMKTTFSKKELEKPFVAARWVFTGWSEDAAVRMMFAQMIAAQALGGEEALYRMTAGSPAAQRAESGHSAVPRATLPQDPQGWQRQLVDAPVEQPELDGGDAPAEQKTEGPAANDQAATPLASTNTAAAPSGSAPKEPAKTEPKAGQQPLPGTSDQREPGDDDDPMNS